MANLFQDVQNQASNLFQMVQPDPQPQVDNREALRTARLAAMGNLDLNQPDLFQAMEAATQENLNLIQTTGENELRRQAVAQSQQEKLTGFVDLIREAERNQDHELVRGANLAALAAIGQETAEREQWELEERAAKRIQDLAASGDITQARLLLNNLEYGSANDVLLDITTKRMILQREISKGQINVDNQGWFGAAASFVLSAIPFNYSMGNVGNVDIPKKLQHWYDNIFSGERLNAERSNLWSMPKEEFVKFVRDELIPRIDENSTLLGWKDSHEKLGILKALGESTPTALETNAFNTLDNLGWLPVLKMSKAATSVPGMMVRLGARKEASEVVAKFAQTAATEGADSAAIKTGMTADEAQSHILPSALNVDADGIGVPLSGDSVRALERGKALLENITEAIQRVDRTQPGELENAILNAQKRLEDQIGRPVQDVEVNSNVLVDGSKVHSVDVTIGKQDGGGFANDKTATRYANSLGYSQNAYKVVRGEDGQYFVKLTLDVPETGFYTNTLNTQANLLSRFTMGARAIGDDFLADLAQNSGNIRNRILKDLKTKYENKFNLDIESKKSLGQVIAKGENDGKWFSVEEIQNLYQRQYKRLPTQKELDAYTAYRDVNDIEYALRNDTIFKEKLLKGFQTGSFDAGLAQVKGANVLVDRNLTTVSRRAYNVNQAVHYNKNNPITPERLQQLKNEGYILVSVEDAVKLSDGTEVKDFIIKAKDTNLEPLSRTQLAYRAGGHRFYEGKYFVRQTVKGILKDTGETYLKNPRTYIVGKTRAEAKYWAEKMEQARLKAATGATAEDLDNIFQGEAGFPTGQEFLDGLGTHFERDVPFVDLYDREMPVEYTRNTEALNYADMEETAYLGWLRNTGKMYTSPKGDILPDFQGRKAPTIDVYDSMNKAMMNVANMSSFSDYKISSIDRFVNTWGEWLDTPGLLGSASTYTKFAKGVVKKETPAHVKQKILAQRDIIERTLGWRSEWDLQAEEATRQLADWVLGTNPYSIRNKVGSALQDWWSNTNPVQMLRGWAFDLKLGLFNPSQLILQAGTAVASMTLSPKHGFHGMHTYPVIRSMLFKGATETTLDHWAKQGVWKSAGFKTEKDFKEFVRSAKTSGFFDFDVGTHAFVNDFGPHAGVSDFGNVRERVRSVGRVFFNEGELLNRAVAYHIAYKEALESHGHLGTKSSEFIRRVQGRAEDYSFSMSRESQAWWQKGVLSIPTQFWAYNARMIEAMMGPQFTPQQKLRLVTGQAMLYGAAGVPGATVLADYFNSKNGEAPEVGSAGAIAQRGLVDNILYGMTGQDVLVSKRFGTGSWLSDTVKDLLGQSQYGEKSFIELAGGATASVMGDVTSGLFKIAKYGAAENGAGPVTREAILDAAKNISTFSNFHKAYLIHQYGTLKTNKGTTIASDLPEGNAFAMAIGFQPGVSEDVSAAMGYTKHRSKIIDEAAKYINNKRTDLLNRPDDQERIQEEVNSFMSMYPPDMRKAIQRKVYNDTEPSLYEGLAKRIEKDKAQKELYRNLDGNAN